MHAIRVRDDGQLAWKSHPRPAYDDDEVLVAVEATAVNRADLLQRRGAYPPPDGASEVLGLEVAGVVAEVGDRVDDWEAGDRVCALLPGGGYAEYAAVPAEMLLEIPDKLDLVDAAGIPEVFYTAYLNLRIEADHDDGEPVLVHAGASGVGSAALQLCHLFDSPTVATASTGKLEFLRDDLGVDLAVDRIEGDFVERIREGTERGEVDVVLDPVGGDYLPRNVEVMAECGRLVIIGLLRGRSAELPMGTVLRNRLRVIGSVLRSRSVEEKIAITERLREEVWPHFQSGELEPVVDTVFPIEEAEEAHDLVASDDTIGKVILRVGAT